MRSVATVGRWSIRHPWLAIVAWLAFVVVAIGLMVATGTESLENGAVGESARGYELMSQHQAWTPAREYGYLHSDTLRADQPFFRAAIDDVASRMRTGLGGDVQIRISRDRHSALV